MNFAFFISDATARALGWTLTHSLWQGTLAALALLILLPRLRTAQQRYWVAYGGLVAVLVAALGTFVWVHEPAAQMPEAVFSAVGGEIGNQFFIDNQLFEPSFWQHATYWVEENYPFVVAVWLVGFAFFLLRILSGLWQIRRLRTQQIAPLPAPWPAKTAALRQRMGSARAVGLFESALVRTPLTIGWLKPVILLPLGLVNRLSPAEVEAVLAHELAHIARRDWIFNLLQAFIESLFYYHPAVWWMSKVVRRERENCCDDTALAATGNPLAFARALVQVQELATPAAPALALAWSGKRRRPLLERVRRILNQPQQKSHIMEKSVATVILLALLALVGLRANNTPSITAALAQITELPAVFFGAQGAENEVVNDTLPKPKGVRKIVREDDDQRVEAEYKDGKLTRLNIDGKEIPEAELEQHEALAEELAESIIPPVAPVAPVAPFGVFEGRGWAAPAPPAPPAIGGFAHPPLPPLPPLISTEKDKDGSTIIRLQKNGNASEIKVKDGKVWLDGKELEEGESLEMDGLLFNNSNGFFFENLGEGGFSFDAPAVAFSFSDEDRARWEEDAVRLRSEAQRLRSEHLRALEESRRDLERDVALLARDQKKNKKEWEKEQKEWEKEQKRWQKEQEQWAREQSKWAAEEARSAAFAQELKASLRRDGLIKDPKNFQFQLSAKELKVNGEKQPSEMHRKYLEFYQAKSGRKLGDKDQIFWSEND
jgi:beta-lactamase regulating signal transducer with metallopeptidase domain